MIYIKLILMLMFSTFAASETFDTQNYCPNHKGKAMVRKITGDCILRILCNQVNVDLFVECRNKSSFFSFSDGVLRHGETITSVRENKSEISFTASTNKISRVLKVVPSKLDDIWIVMMKKEKGFFKFKADYLYFNEVVSCKPVNNSTDKKCYKEMKVSY